MLGLHGPSCWKLSNCECLMQCNKQKFLWPQFDLFIKHVKFTSAEYKEHMICPSRLWCITPVWCLQHWPMRLGVRKTPLYHHKPQTLISGSLSELHFLCSDLNIAFQHWSWWINFKLFSMSLVCLIRSLQNFKNMLVEILPLKFLESIAIPTITQIFLNYFFQVCFLTCYI